MTDAEAHRTLESKAARLAEGRLEWNELDFVEWREFRRMAPAVVGMEIGRIERVMRQMGPKDPAYNDIVRVRFALRTFVEGLEHASQEALPDLAEHLRTALLALSLMADRLDSETLRYAAHRLRYVHDRMNLIY